MDLPEPETPVTATNRPSGMSTVRSLQVVGSGADHPQPMLRRRLSPPGRHGDTQLVAEVAAGERLGMAADILDRALGNHLAAEASGPRAQIDHVVGRLDGFLVVLDDDDGVPQIPQPAQRGEQPLVVPLMQSDAGLIEDVEHPHQPRADLGGQPDALGLAPGQRRRGPAQGQVVQTHIAQEAEPVHYFLQYRTRDVGIETYRGRCRLPRRLPRSGMLSKNSIARSIGRSTTSPMLVP